VAFSAYNRSPRSIAPLTRTGFEAPQVTQSKVSGIWQALRWRRRDVARPPFPRKKRPALHKRRLAQHFAAPRPKKCRAIPMRCEIVGPRQSGGISLTCNLYASLLKEPDRVPFGFQGGRPEEGRVQG